MNRGAPAYRKDRVLSQGALTPNLYVAPLLSGNFAEGIA